MARRRSKKPIVLDSSVIVKWFAKEEGSLTALKILDEFTDSSLPVLVSEIAFYEVANALRYKPDFAEEDVGRCITRLIELEMEVRKLYHELIRTASKIAFEGEVTFYDAVPVAIAMIEKITCVTADRKTQFVPLRQKHYPVRILDEYAVGA